MTKEELKQKYCRQSLWFHRHALAEKENEFLSDMGWKAGAGPGGVVGWKKLYADLDLVYFCDRSTALAIAHAELFDPLVDQTHGAEMPAHNGPLKDSSNA